jgi:hypothetical protein
VAPRVHREPAAPDVRTTTASVAAPADTRVVRSMWSMAPTTVAGWLTLVWAVGACAIILRLLAGLAAVQWLSRGTAQVIDAPSQPLAIELASRVGV